MWLVHISGYAGLTDSDAAEFHSHPVHPYDILIMLSFVPKDIVHN